MLYSPVRSSSRLYRPDLIDFAQRADVSSLTTSASPSSGCVQYSQAPSPIGRQSLGSPLARGRDDDGRGGAKARSCRRVRQTSIPSMSGNRASTTTTSGSGLRAISRA